MENKIYFSGTKKDTKLADKLCRLCSEELDIDAVTVVLTDCEETIIENAEAVAVEFGKTAPEGFSTVTYSVGQSNADICGFNFQKRERSRSLELLSGSFMGRVNIPVDSEFSEKSVIYCAAGLMAAGVPINMVLKLINEKIS